MSEERRKKILEAGSQLFFHYGYRRTTMGDIAREAGISRPTLYAMYKNKESVFAGVAEQYVAQLERKIEDSFVSSAPLREKLRKVLEHAVIEPFSMFHGTTTKWELMSIEDPQVQESLRELTDAHDRIYARCFEGEESFQSRLGRNPLELGRIVNAAAMGLKERAKDLQDLEFMLETLVTLLEQNRG